MCSRLFTQGLEIRTQVLMVTHQVFFLSEPSSSLGICTFNIAHSGGVGIMLGNTLLRSFKYLLIKTKERGRAVNGVGF